ncbi:MAG: phage holin family protein [Candidatus Kerfeldbacteria bacterium]|nr:phage holin family protein [Candidatus Kerfeldbacteria bacterium]
MNLIIRLILNAAALIAVTYVVPGFEVDSFWYALIAAVVLGLVNAIIKPILIIFTLPITILTLGLFTFVINALLIWVVASFLPGFEVEGFIAALLGGLAMWVMSWFTNAITKK